MVDWFGVRPSRRKQAGHPRYVTMKHRRLLTGETETEIEHNSVQYNEQNKVKSNEIFQVRIHHTDRAV